MRGRKPKPTQLKILQGNPGHQKINKNELQPGYSIPDPPDHLSEVALEEWNRIAPLFFAQKLMSPIYMAALAAYCQAYGRWVEAEEELAVEGSTIKTSNGNIIQNPLVGIANTAMLLMDRFGVQFGYTPSAIARLGRKDTDDTDEMAEFLKRANERKEVDVS